MARRYSDRLLQELHSAVEHALQREGMINVSAIALEMHARSPFANMSIAELEAQILASALAMNAIILFQRPIPGQTEALQELSGCASHI